MTYGLRRCGVGLAFIALFALWGCVWESDYDTLQAKNQQLQQEVSSLQARSAAEQAQINRLQNAIRFTVNSDLLFLSGGRQMSDAGKDIIAKFAARLVPAQQDKLIVNGYTDNTPVGPDLARQGITSSLVLSQKRAENVTEFLISRGVGPELVAAQGHGDAEPVASNNTREGRAQNRRVELALAGSGS